MKIIDLLVKIANNEEVPKKIKTRISDEVFTFNEDYKRYLKEDGKTLGEFLALDLFLDYEIEIIEEKPKKIEKLDLYEDLQDILNSPDKSIVLNAIHKCLLVEKYKINELIDYLLEKESDK